MNFQPVAIGIEPSPYVAVFVVRRVILNEHGSLLAIAASQLFQESEVGRSIEDSLAGNGIGPSTIQWPQKSSRSCAAR